MENIDWVRLWLLNELVCSPRSLEYLIHRPRSESSAYWLFPAGPAIRAELNVRADCLFDCANKGLVRLYDVASLHSTRFNDASANVASITNRDIEMHGYQECETVEAVLTQSGYLFWEHQFQPNWERWWLLDSDRQSSKDGERVLAVLYASNDILNDLNRWFPVYWGLDLAHGLTLRSCHTLFNYQVGPWTTLPFVKRVEWCAKDSQWLPENLLKADEDKSKQQSRIREYQYRQSEDGLQACRILECMSNKWVCEFSDLETRHECNPNSL